MMGNETKQKFYFFFLPSWYDVVIRLFFLHWNGKLTSTMLYAPTQLHSQYFTFHLQRTTQKQQEEIWVLIFSHSLLTFHQFHSGWRWIFCNFFFCYFWILHVEMFTPTTITTPQHSFVSTNDSEGARLVVCKL
jgi:hypothetical protein